MRLNFIASMCLVLTLSACADWNTTGFYGDEFYKLDANRDLSLSPAEMVHGYPASVFKEMDVDGSGDVTPMEYYRYPNSVRNN